MTEPVLSIRDLTVRFDVDGTTTTAVQDVDLDVGADEVVALVGESGSGKSVTAMSVLGLLPRNAQVTGSIRFEGRELLGVSSAGLRAVRGDGIAMVFQDPVAALDPVFSVGFQLVEAIRAHRRMPLHEARARAVDLLTQVEIPDPEERMRFYPHQLSGGQAQRVVIAIALAGEPRLLIADEPTTALDVTVQAEVLDVLRSLRGKLRSSILLITHDMGVVADLADRVVVMRKSRVVESGDAVSLFARPQHEYTRALLDAVPRVGDRPVTTSEIVEPTSDRTAIEPPALDVRDLVVEYGSRLRGRVRAVDSVTFQVARGEILGLVGESGSGKTTIGRAALRLAPIASGSIQIAGVDVAAASGTHLTAMRRNIGTVFQNPAASLNPRYSVRTSIAEPLRVHAGLRGAALQERVEHLLESVGLDDKRHLDRYPHELSGGQRQRVSIARAVALDPDLLIADEPTSALDVSVQARVLDVFAELQERLGFACLFISHDLAVVDALCDRIAVLQHGALVELDDRERVLQDPEHPYTRLLIASAPVPDPVEQRRRRELRSA